MKIILMFSPLLQAARPIHYIEDLVWSSEKILTQTWRCKLTLINSWWLSNCLISVAVYYKLLVVISVSLYKGHIVQSNMTRTLLLWKKWEQLYTPCDKKPSCRQAAVFFRYKLSSTFSIVYTISSYCGT